MSKKILLIDDDRVNNSLIQSGLEKRNYDVVVTCDGDFGLEMVKAENPDLIILDIEMPRMNGYTFISELRKMEKDKYTPVIVLTSHQDLKPIFQLKGARDYLVKPITIEAVCEKVEKFLGPAEDGAEKI
jgi:two-component system chemotaxis response regulator CheY